MLIAAAVALALVPSPRQTHLVEQLRPPITLAEVAPGRSLPAGEIVWRSFGVVALGALAAEISYAAAGASLRCQAGRDCSGPRAAVVVLTLVGATAGGYLGYEVGGSANGGHVGAITLIVGSAALSVALVLLISSLRGMAFS